MKYVIKTFQLKTNEKLRNYVFKIKESNKSILRKGFFASIKGELCSTKRHVSNEERQVKIEYRLIKIFF